MKYAKNPEIYDWLRDSENSHLADIVTAAGITVLVGACGQPGCFTKEVIEAVTKNTQRPVILPLSDYDQCAEAVPMDIERWSNGRALIAHGSNCGVSTSEESNPVLAPCNNVLIFPGVALGTLVSGARQVLPEFFTAAAKAVAESVSKEAFENGQLVPRVSDMREVAIRVANDVAMSAVKEGVSRPCAFSDYKHENDQVRMKRLISGIRWEPEYLPLTAM